jgi:hypothetical protein
MEDNRGMGSLERRYRKLLKKRQHRREHTGTTQGTCMTFCPEFEGLERTLRNDLSPFESDVMIKKYYRSSAGRGRELGEDVRPAAVLLDVTNHLLDLCRNSLSLELYKFVENRSRAVRIDMAVQEIEDGRATEILEKIARMHILFGYFLFDDRRFEVHLNLDQLKKIIITLMELYKKSPVSAFGFSEDNREEFMSYHLLMSVSEKELEIPETSPRTRLCFEILRAFQQHNFHSFFRLTRKLDFLSFCVIHNFYDVARLNAVSTFSRSFVEKIDVDFFNRTLWTTDNELASLFRRRMIEVENRRANFKDKGDDETEEALVKERKILPNMQSPSKLLWMGSVDYRVFILVLADFCLRKVGQRAEKIGVEDRRIDTGEGTVPASSKGLIMGVCKSVLDDLMRHTAVSRLSLFLSKRRLTGFFDLWRNRCNVSKSTLKGEKIEKKILLVVLDQKIFSALFKSKVNNSILNTLEPAFAMYDNAKLSEMLEYNLCVFSVARKDHEKVNEKYRMVNRIVDIPQNLSNMIDEIYRTAMRLRKVVCSRLAELVQDGSVSQKTSIITALIENGRNSKELENNLILIHKGRPIDDCDVYYEKDTALF